jgi:hypothetical protein
MSGFSPDISNKLFFLAAQMVNHSDRHIFLTGKAGTGKTTFLKYIKNNTHKQMAIVAPTGVAAINAGGVTMHSFFQLPVSPFIPDDNPFGLRQDGDNSTNQLQLLSTLKMNGEKKKIIRELELLVIDEVSMVRCDTLDAIDTVMRHIRRNYLQAFGGVQVLFIGDLFQLPPVTPAHDWRILSQFYEGPYFFNSRVLERNQPVCIELTKIYRQQEERFIELLNQVRNNRLDATGLALLNERLDPGFNPPKEAGYIRLVTRNAKVDSINAIELEQLEGRTYSFKADIKGDFSDKAFPADETLKLKIGAQVMFIKNDLDQAKRYFNGKIGRVVNIKNDAIYVQCDTDADEIEVKTTSWDNIRYNLNESTRQLEEEAVGSFTQYPLRLAWAITVHKSQGLTFERAIIDAGDAFEKGQVYVSLSRCTTLDGLKLHTMIRNQSLFSDNRVIAFSEKNLPPEKLSEVFSNAEQDYTLRQIQQLFDYTGVQAQIKETGAYLLEHKTSFNEEAFSWQQNLQEAIDAVQEVAIKFQAQLQQLFVQLQQQELMDKINERVIAAINKYFTGHNAQLLQQIQQTAVVTDSRMKAADTNEFLKELYIAIDSKQHIMTALNRGWNSELYSERKKNYTVSGLRINTYAAGNNAAKLPDSPHPQLYSQLKTLRDKICRQRDIPVYLVASSVTLDEMARYLPLLEEDLMRITGFGPKRVEQYGADFLQVIQAYCEVKGLASLVDTIPAAGKKKAAKTADTKEKEKPVKVNTKQVSFDLFKQGKDIIAIAQERNMAISTIEGHMAHYIQSGEIDILEVMNEEKFLLIKPHLENYTETAAGPIKEKLGNDVSFGEIRLAMAWKNRE